MCKGITHFIRRPLEKKRTVLQPFLQCVRYSRFQAHNALFVLGKPFHVNLIPAHKYFKFLQIFEEASFLLKYHDQSIHNTLKLFPPGHIRIAFYLRDIQIFSRNLPPVCCTALDRKPGFCLIIAVDRSASDSRPLRDLIN